MKKMCAIISLLLLACLLTYSQDGENGGNFYNFLRSLTGDSKLGVLAIAGMAEKLTETNPQAALLKIEEAIELAHRMQEVDVFGILYVHRGLIYTKLSKYEYALADLDRAISFFENKKGKDVMAACASLKGIIYADMGEFIRARVEYDEALVLWQEAKRVDGVAEVYANISRLYSYQGDINRAIEYAEKALELIKKVTPGSREASYYHNLGAHYTEKGNFELARTQYEMALSVVNKKKDLSQQADIFASLGNLAYFQGDYAQARQYYFRAKDYAERTINTTSLYAAYQNLGHLASIQGRSEEAYYYFQRALSISREAHSPLLEAAAFQAIGSYYIRQPNFEKSLDYYFKSLSLAEQMGTRKEMGQLYVNIGICSYADNPLKALTYFQKAEQIFLEAGIKNYLIFVYLNTARVYKNLEKYEKAHSTFHQALQLANELGMKSQSAAAWLNIGTVYIKQKSFKEAQDAFLEALSVQNELDEGENKPYILEQLANAYIQLNNFPAALVQLEEAMPIFQKRKNQLGQAQVHAFRGEIFYHQKNYTVALEEFEKSIRLFEDFFSSLSGEISKHALMRQAIYTYEWAVICAIRLGEVAKAFHFVERAKSKTLLELLSEAGIKNEALPLHLQKEERLLEDRLHAIDTWMQESPTEAQARLLIEEKEKLMLQRQILVAKIREEVPAYAQLKYPEPTQLNSLQSMLKPEETFLNYFIGDKQAFVFIISATQTDVVELDSAKVIEEAVVDFRKHIARIQRGYKENKPILLSKLESRFLKVSSRLYQLLWKPLESKLPSQTRKVYISPSASLCYLPFGLLIRDREVKPFPAYDYLLLDYAFCYQPSATVSVYEQKNKRQKITYSKDLLAFGNPGMASDKVLRDNFRSGSPFRSFPSGWEDYFAPLPEAEREVKDIARLFPPNRRDIYVQQAATEERIKSLPLKDYKYIHLSSHGRINTDHPYLSAILFNQDTDTTENGFLCAYEIMKLNMRSELVVLSACETGLGRLVKGEGLIGLPRALRYAGAESVIMSLWSVADESTANLFIDFYTLLTQSATHNKHQALRQAQINMIQQTGDHANPYFWGAFVHWGGQ